MKKESDIKSKEGKETSITFRTTKELKDKLELISNKESRTLSNMIELLLQRELETSKIKK